MCHGQQNGGVTPVWGLDDGVPTPHRKNNSLRNVAQDPGLRRILWMVLVIDPDRKRPLGRPKVDEIILKWILKT
jgi:hypothetical protein